MCASSPLVTSLSRSLRREGRRFKVYAGRSADQELQDCREIDNLVLHARECAKGAHRDSIPEGCDDFAEPCVHLLSLTFAILLDHSDHVVRRRCSLSWFHSLLLSVLRSRASCVRPRPRLRASGWLPASPGARHGYRGN